MHNRGEFDNSSYIYYSYICFYLLLCYEYSAENLVLFHNNVEKLCRTLSKKLRICCENFFITMWKSIFYVINVWTTKLFHRTVEKSYTLFYTANNRLGVQFFTVST